MEGRCPVCGEDDRGCLPCAAVELERKLLRGRAEFEKLRTENKDLRGKFERFEGPMSRLVNEILQARVASEHQEVFRVSSELRSILDDLPQEARENPML